jgi:hypothetical protein
MSAPSISFADPAAVTPEALATVMKVLQSSAAPAVAATMMPAAALAAGPWSRPAAAAAPMPGGVLVQVNLPLPDGSEAPLQLLFGAEHAASPQTLVALVGGLISAGIPVKTWQPKREHGGGWGSGDRGGDRGGYGRRRGGY